MYLDALGLDKMARLCLGYANMLFRYVPPQIKTDGVRDSLSRNNWPLATWAV